MGARALLVGLVCTATAVAAVGCGGDDGLRTRAEAEPLPLAPVPELEGDADDFALDGAGLQERLPVDRPEAKKRKRKAKKEERPQRRPARSGRHDNGEAARTEVLSETRDNVPEPPTVEPPLEEADYEAEVRATVAELERRVNARDESLCSDLFTQRHVEAFTGTKGDAAQARCRWYVAGSEVTYEVESIDRIAVTATDGVVTFTSSAGGNSATQTVRVVNADGWKFDGRA